jgi:carbon-monoxide dehydrogenase small subunit
MKPMIVNVTVNDEQCQWSHLPNETLLEVLRREGYVEVKSGCEKGDCGACAVLVNGAAVDSCITLAGTLSGKTVTTTSGLSAPEELHPIHQAYIECGAAQCGYCTPGFVIATQSLLDEIPDPSDDDIRIGLSGNLCRCTGYAKIFDAVRRSAATLKQV